VTAALWNFLHEGYGNHRLGTESDERHWKAMMGQGTPPEPGRKMMSQQISGNAAPGAPLGHGRMEAELQDHIGRQLRAVYNEILQEPIPDRFLRLLADLRGREGSST
jgi:hypothetical protein